jgi:hypothetical protein
MKLYKYHINGEMEVFEIDSIESSELFKGLFVFYGRGFVESCFTMNSLLFLYELNENQKQRLYNRLENEIRESTIKF